MELERDGAGMLNLVQRDAGFKVNILCWGLRLTMLDSRFSNSGCRLGYGCAGDLAWMCRA